MGGCRDGKRRSTSSTGCVRLLQFEDHGLPIGDQRYGLTAAQRATLTQAVAEGYSSIPRQVSTKELAGELRISDRIVTGRLRRAVRTLVTNALMPPDERETGS